MQNQPFTSFTTEPQTSIDNTTNSHTLSKSQNSMDENSHKTMKSSNFFISFARRNPNFTRGLPYVGAFIGSIVALATAFSLYQGANMLRSVYFIQFDVHSMNLEYLDTSSSSSSVNSTHQAGLADHYGIGANSLCKVEYIQGSTENRTKSSSLIKGDSQTSETIQYCEHERTPFTVTFTEVMNEDLNRHNITLSSPQGVEAIDSYLASATKNIWTAYTVAVSFIVVEFVAVIVTWGFYIAGYKTGWPSLAAFVINILALPSSAVAGTVAKTTMTHYRDQFNSNKDSLGIEASLGKTGFVLAWLMVGGLAWSLLWQILGYILLRPDFAIRRNEKRNVDSNDTEENEEEEDVF